MLCNNKYCLLFSSYHALLKVLFMSTVAAVSINEWDSLCVNVMQWHACLFISGLLSVSRIVPCCKISGHSRLLPGHGLLAHVPFIWRECSLQLPQVFWCFYMEAHFKAVRNWFYQLTTQILASEDLLNISNLKSSLINWEIWHDTANLLCLWWCHQLHDIISGRNTSQPVEMLY